MGNEVRIRAVTQFIVIKDVEEIGDPEFIDGSNLTDFDFESAIKEALLILELIDTFAVGSCDTAGESMHVQVSA
jgi:hypothetical protein